MNVRDAYKLARKKADVSLELQDCVELSDKWAFLFDTDDDMPTPGTPYITVAKNGGKINYLTIPPMENLLELNSGKQIDISDVI